MQRKSPLSILCLASCFLATLTLGMMCETDTGMAPGPGPGAGPGPGPGSGLDSLNVTKTNIDVRHDARVAVGDGIIAYGTGPFLGVDYIEVGDASGRGVPNGASFLSKHFAVAGKKIIFVSNFQLTVFNTVDQSSSTIPATDIRLQSIPTGIHSPGSIHADGNFVGTMNSPTDVTDGKRIKVVDVSNAAPQVISFTNDPAVAPTQLAVDATNPHVAVAADDIFYVYDIQAPTAAPMQFDVSGRNGIASDTVIQFHNGLILYHDNASFGNARILNTADGSVMTLNENPAAQTLALRGGKYCYFVDRDSDDSVGTVNRSGVGEVANAAPMLAGNDQVTSGTNNNGRVGWNQTAAITPNGEHFFLAGIESIGQQEWLMHGTGGAFSLVPDPDDASADGIMASDVTANSSLVGFKHGTNETTQLGYIEL